MIDLIEQEIVVLRDHINRHCGVGCYVDQCRVWAYYVEAYERILRLVPQTLDNSENRAKCDDER